MHANLPSRLLEHVSCTVGDLFVDAALLGGVNLALTELLLSHVETYQ